MCVCFCYQVPFFVCSTKLRDFFLPLSQVRKAFPCMLVMPPGRYSRGMSGSRYRIRTRVTWFKDDHDTCSRTVTPEFLI